MKKFLYSLLLLFFCSVVLVSCGGGDDDPIENTTPTPGGEGSIMTVDKTFSDNAAHELTITFKALEKWWAKSETTWMTVSPELGNTGESQTITIKIDENTSSEARSGKVIVETVNGMKTFVTVNVSQKGREIVFPVNPYLAQLAEMSYDASELVKQINVGWNLGNTCESTFGDGYNGDVDTNGETAWGQPKTTQAMIDALYLAGFNAIRIPTRWYLHADDDMNIRDAWFTRIKQIVDYAYNRGMYVILNSHHDNWYDRLPVVYDEAAIHAKFEKMWTQIAIAFKDYDERLIFAGVNEIIRLNDVGEEDWGAPTAENIEFANNLMQLFVNTVRATGGNNKWRCLMVQPWAASPSNALNKAYELPKDVVENRLIQEFHCYDPYNYAIGKDQKDNKWAQHEVSQSDYNSLSKLFANMKANFVDNGTPVIMAEFGSTQDNHYSKGDAEADKIRADYHKFVVSEAKKNGFPGFYWDNGAFSGDGENFGLLDRKNCTFPDRAKIALQGIMDGLK